jgi:hypothetical protein
MPKKPTVWITQKRDGLDFVKAEAFGFLIHVLDEKVHPADIGTITEVARSVANEFSNEDKILPTASVSSTVMMAALVAELSGHGFTGVNLLIFDAKSGEYKERRLQL